jgi:peptidoglycan/xylan/chitin deacetylase (PgdA/CDA1 family)
MINLNTFGPCKPNLSPSLIRHNGNTIGKCVVLTADDAYQSMVKSAYPLLKKYQMPMSVFVSSEPVDKK